MFFFLEQAKISLEIDWFLLSVSYASKKEYGASKTSGVLGDGASGANRGCVAPPQKTTTCL